MNEISKKTSLSSSELSSSSAVKEESPKPTKSPYPGVAPTPTQVGPEGIRYDFNEGCRVLLPKPASGTWHIRLTDLDTGNTLFEKTGLGEAFVRSAKRWFVRFGIQVWKETQTAEGGRSEEKLVFTHEMDVTGQEVFILFPVGTLGDTLAWMPYAARFAVTYQARVTCALSALIQPIFKDAYPDIKFLTPEEVAEQTLTQNAYATYYLGLFFDDAACDWQPADFRLVGLHKTAAYILGVNPDEEAARISFPDEGRPIAEPYVCIAAQASSQAKYWNNPNGWGEVISWLKAQGYRVICIDREKVHGTGIVWNHIPYGVEDQTGNRPLAERARWLKHAEFFIGLGSGLSWLAWSVGTPVVMIAGFSHPTTEFQTPYRVINWHTCNSCWNDPKERFNHQDFLWCPRHAGTPRQFECTRLITAKQVIEQCKNILKQKGK